MTFFGKPSGGPDAIGGLFPRQEVQPFRSRAGTAALVNGSVMVLDTSASATALATNDSNTGLPGAGDSTDDSIWNTVVDPTVNHIGSAAGHIPTLAVVSLGAVATNGIGKFQTYGIVDEARCLCSGTISNLQYGTPLTYTITNSFNATIVATNKIVAFYCGVDQTATNSAVIGRVFLHNGVGWGSGQTGVAVP